MAVPSPCKLICKYDDDGQCIGCRRTKEEIMHWPLYNDQQKLDVWKKIKLRKNNPAILN